MSDGSQFPKREAWLVGDSEMVQRIRVFDWSTTPLGPAEAWSPALRMVIQLLLANRFPMILWWGPQFVQFYNDAYRPIPGNKHPNALGQPASECWPEIWHVIGPLIETPFQGGPATWMEDIYLEVNRRGFVEETHFTIAYSPVPDDKVASGIGGVLATVHEITGKVVGDRRVLVLRDLAARSAEARTAEEACTIAAETLAQHAKDIPFALLYLIDPDCCQRARLAGSASVATGQAAIPPVIGLEDDESDRSPWPLRQVMGSEAMETVTDLGRRFGGQVPQGPWTDPPHTAVVVPIRSNKTHVLAGFLVAGISVRLQLDEAYRDFLNLVVSQIATAIAHAREYEEEKKRAEALAEIDRAKTLFFSNVSHEFRTPLTLMLGPTEDALASPERALHGEDLDTVHRNALRLLKLVNTLLDFSRIEAGRIEASYGPVDLAGLTADLASVFRSAIEKAGLRLVVDCPPLPEPVYVDREMWEKIILNLLSNAFKFTFEGEITIAVRWQGDHAELAVRDTGIGIPPDQLTHLFERFHRVPNVQSRTHEGTGIGLALVKELVRYHGGSIAVDSVVDRGTTFTVCIPTGFAHLPSDRLCAAKTLASTALGALPYVEEALRWLPEAERRDAVASEPLAVSDRGFSAVAPDTGGELARVLVADDNADMRQYLRQLLSPYWTVEAVPDGGAALDAARRERPDLVLTDIMMPGLDGFELLRRLRADPTTREIPVILLSARAGEEARVEGLAAGADDYLVKPFSARELVAHVRSHLQLAQVRREAARALGESEGRLRLAKSAAQLGIYDYDLQTGQLQWDERVRELWGVGLDEPLTYGMFLAGLHPDDREATQRAVNQALDPAGNGVYSAIYRVISQADGLVRWIEAIGQALFEQGRAVRLIGTVQDITERKQAEETLRETDRCKDEFLATLAHELRNPLAPIRTALEVLCKTVDPSPTVDRLLEMMNRQMTHLVRLVDDLLEVSRFTQGKIELRREQVDVAAIVGQAIDTSRPPIDAGHHALEVSLPPEPLLIEADPVRLVQVVANLLNNAAKYMEPGGTIRVVAERHGDEAVVSVRDTGIGMPAELLPRVFEFFTQADRSMDRAQGGLGIGLALVRHLVEMHGGTVTACSAGPGCGSEFVVRLPVLVEPPKVQMLPDRSEASTPVAARRILVVDDNRDATNSLAEILELAGHEMRIAYDGEEGIEVAASFRPEVILLDLGMPKMDGYEACRHLREQPWGRGMTVVALTGWGQEEDRRKASAAGFDGHLVKPVDYDTLMRLITSLPTER